MVKRVLAPLLALFIIGSSIGQSQTTGFIFARPTSMPLTLLADGTSQSDNINYLQGPKPIRLNNGDIAILVNAGQCCNGDYEALFTLLYPGSGGPPQFFPLWASNNWGNDLARNENETGYPVAIFSNAQWHVAYTATFHCPNLNCDRVGRLDLPSLTAQAQPAQVVNQWIPPVDPACRELGSCTGPGSGIMPSLVTHPDGSIFVYHGDGSAVTCPSRVIRHRLNPDMSVPNPGGDGCLVFNGLLPGKNAPVFYDVARGADGALYMLGDKGPGGPIGLWEWKSTEGDNGYPLGLYWRLTGKEYVVSAPPPPGFPGESWAADSDAAYLTDSNGLIAEPRVVVAQISHGIDWDHYSNAALGNWWLYYWADAGATLPPGFGASNQLAPPPVYGSGEQVWVDDQLPAGAQVDEGPEPDVPFAPFLWDLAQKASGAQSHTHPNVNGGTSQHYFYDAIDTMAVGGQDLLFTYVLINPANPPREIMLQWKVGSGAQQWEHRAFWGADLIPLGTLGTASRYSMGALPVTGQWVRLSVPADAVGLAGQCVNGLAFTTYGGQAWFDRSGNMVPRVGDVNGDGSLNASDIFYLISAIFAGGPAPVGSGDVNADGVTNSSDIFYLINYLFAGGPPPRCAPAPPPPPGGQQGGQTTDVLTIGAVTVPSGTGTVEVPIFIQDTTGTVLGRDKGAGLKISGIALQVTYGPNPCMDTPASASQRINLTGGILASQSADTDSRVKVANTSQSWIYSSAETNGLIPFTAASAPGDLIGKMVFNLTGCSGGTINLVVTVAGAATALLSSDSGTSETVGNGLAVVNGAINIGPPPPITLVQKTTAGNQGVTSISGAFPSPPTAGNLLVAIVGVKGTDTINTPTDQNGMPNGWLTAINQGGMAIPTRPGQAIFYKIAGASETATVKETLTGSNTTLAIQLFEYRGIAASGSLDGTSGANGTGSDPASTGTVTTSASDDLLLAAIATDGADNVTAAGNSFIIEQNFVAGSGNGRETFASADRKGSTSNNSTTFTHRSNTWRAQIAAFRHQQ